MKVGQILSQVCNSGVADVDISDIADDSRLTENGSLFFLRKRKHFDIFSLLDKKDLNKKVRAYVADKKDRKQVEARIKNRPVIYVSQVEKSFHLAVSRFYEPEKKLEIIGVTGTNGKTSTAYFLYQLLEGLGKRTAFFGTTGYLIGLKNYDARHTTADLITICKLIKKASSQGVSHLVVEASSHGIIQGRLKGLKFSRCLFTNLGRDHLDYHKTMKNYFKAKKRFFLENSSALSVINNDCPYGRKLGRCLKKTVFYGIKNEADYRAGSIKFLKNKISFNLLWDKKNISFSFNLTGYHNIYNLLAAIAAIHSLGFSFSRISGLVPRLKAPEGRLQEVFCDIFVDYAHTPDGLASVLSSLRRAGYQQIISLFGCGGQRDKGKRQAMGRVSRKFSDFTIITSDNPRKENPVDICNQIKAGFKGDKFKIILSRRRAIKEGLKMHRRQKKESCRRSCLVVAGKGHEGYQELKNRKVKFKDAEVIKGFLKNEDF